VQSVYCDDDNVFHRQFLAELISKRNLLYSDSTSSSCLVPYKYLTLLVPSMYDERWQNSPRCLPATEILKYLSKADQKRSAIDPEVVFCDFENKMFRHIVTALNITTTVPSNGYSQELVKNEVIYFHYTDQVLRKVRGGIRRFNCINEVFFVGSKISRFLYHSFEESTTVSLL